MRVPLFVQRIPAPIPRARRGGWFLLLLVFSFFGSGMLVPQMTARSTPPLAIALGKTIPSTPVVTPSSFSPLPVDTQTTSARPDIFVYPATTIDRAIWKWPADPTPVPSPFGLLPGQAANPTTQLPQNPIPLPQLYPIYLKSSHPSTSPFPSGSAGYDASYPQCKNTGHPIGASWALLGLNNGKAFTENPCINELIKNRPISPLFLYLNTSYDPSNLSKITAPCMSGAGKLTGLDSDQVNAYALGCSEAEYDLSIRVTPPIMWWLDIETANSWSTADLSLNQWTIKGLTERLDETGLGVGAYSVSQMWPKIFGSWQYPVLRADWMALGQPSDCGHLGFSGSPTWIIQGQDPAIDGGGLADADWAC